MKKTVLVTGGAGYIGSACVAALVERGDKVVVYDNLSTGQKDKIPAQVNFVEGDINDVDNLDQTFKEHSFDAVMHFAALKSVEDSEKNPSKYFHNNVVGTLQILKLMETHKVPHIVFSSSAAVYEPNPSLVSFSETDTVNPINVYGRTKLIAETCIKEYARVKAIDSYHILRYFNVAGDAGLFFKEKDAKNIFPLLMRSLEEERPFSIFGTDYPTEDGTCVRDYIHLSDLAEAHLLALDHTGSGIYNLGTSEGYSVRQIVEAFEKVTGKKLVVEEAPRRQGDPAILLANYTTARTELGWQPTKTLKEMVESLVVTHRS